MELRYESFNMPTDGLTRVEELDSYKSEALSRDGWTMVGVMSAPSNGGDPRLFGVFRMTSDDALNKSVAERQAIEKSLSELQSKVWGLENQIKGLTSALQRAAVSGLESAPDKDQ